jgi:hypothetical protein
MTILTKYLIENAKAGNNESYDVVSHLGVGTDTLTIDVSDTSLPGEIGTRVSLTGSRTNNTVEFEGIRVSTDVVGTGGDNIKGVALFDAASNGGMYVENIIAGLLHTTNFDVDFIETINWVGSQ